MQAEEKWVSHQPLSVPLLTTSRSHQQSNHDRVNLAPEQVPLLELEFQECLERAGWDFGVQNP